MQQPSPAAEVAALRRSTKPMLKSLSFLGMLPALSSRAGLHYADLGRRLEIDRFLALWIAVAMGLGILIGYFTQVSAVLEKVHFVDVPVPLG